MLFVPLTGNLILQGTLNAKAVQNSSCFSQVMYVGGYDPKKTFPIKMLKVENGKGKPPKNSLASKTWIRNT